VSGRFPARRKYVVLRANRTVGSFGLASAHYPCDAVNRHMGVKYITSVYETQVDLETIPTSR